MVTSIIRRRPMAWMVVVSLAVLAVVLTACGSDSGSSTATGASASSAGSASVMTVNVKESKSTTGDVYTCDPTTITVKKGDSVTFTNMSDENQDFDQGDSVKAGVDFKIGLNQSIPATFKTAGTFTIKSEKGATFTVTVQ